MVMMVGVQEGMFRQEVAVEEGVRIQDVLTRLDKNSRGVCLQGRRVSKDLPLRSGMVLELTSTSPAARKLRRSSTPMV